MQIGEGATITVEIYSSVSNQGDNLCVFLFLCFYALFSCLQIIIVKERPPFFLAQKWLITVVKSPWYFYGATGGQWCRNIQESLGWQEGMLTFIVLL